MNIFRRLRGLSTDSTPGRTEPRLASSVDGRAIADTIHRALGSAGLDTQSGTMKNVADTIQEALTSAGLYSVAPTPLRRAKAVTRLHGKTDPTFRRGVIEGISSQVVTPRSIADVEPFVPGAPSDPARQGQFLSRSFTNQAGTRPYRLYIPASYAGDSRDPVPMIVMLHGCTQSPEDFAAGTRMNELAEQHGFLVVYPGQSATANGSKCWNWFRAEDQDRDRGEPSIVAGITQEVANTYRVDRRRIFVAGLSAGAAMAAILGATYPDLYAAIGIHSGLPYRAAHDMPTAFSAMQGANPAARCQPSAHQGPTIVFHGDSDHTVNQQNAAAIVEQATSRGADKPRLRASVSEGVAGGRSYRRTVYAEAGAPPVVEHWILHGAGHAWSGGSSRGSFTDAEGPDASAEIVRFFYSQLRAGSA